MIVLKILLYVLLGVLGLILAVVILALVLPVRADVDFAGGKLSYNLKFAFFSLADSGGGGFLKRKKKKQSEPETPEEPEEDLYFSEDSEEEEPGIEIDIPITEEIPEPEEDLQRKEKIRKIKEKKNNSVPEPEEEDESEDEPEKEEEKSLADKIEFIISIWDIAGRPLLKIFRGFHVRKVYIDFIVAGEDAYKCALAYGAVSGTVYNLLAWLGELFTVTYKTVDIRPGFAIKKSQWDCSCKVDFRLYTLVFSALWFLIIYVFKIYIPKKNGRKKSGK